MRGMAVGAGRGARRTATLGLLVALLSLVMTAVAAAATTTTTTTAGTNTTVTAVGGTAASTSTTVETTPAGEPICVTCHESVTPEVVRTWRSQNHGKNHVGCPVCHGGHDAAFFHPKPAAGVCFTCHDVAKIHGGDFTPATPGARCMECHTSNVHWLPGPESWFQGGLPPQDLVAGPPPPPVSVAAGKAAGIIIALSAVAVGLLLGFMLNSFIRNL